MEVDLAHAPADQGKPGHCDLSKLSRNDMHAVSKIHTCFHGLDAAMQAHVIEMILVMVTSSCSLGAWGCMHPKLRS